MILIDALAIHLEGLSFYSEAPKAKAEVKISGGRAGGSDGQLRLSKIRQITKAVQNAGNE